MLLEKKAVFEQPTDAFTLFFPWSCIASQRWKPLAGIYGSVHQPELSELERLMKHAESLSVDDVDDQANLGGSYVSFHQVP